MENKFIYVWQLNSGGYTIEDPKLGIGEYMIFEVSEDFGVREHLERIDELYDGNIFDYCECCGERWDSFHYEEIDTDINSFMENKKKDMAGWHFAHSRCYIHKLDGTFEEYSLNVDIDYTKTSLQDDFIGVSKETKQ